MREEAEAEEEGEEEALEMRPNPMSGDARNEPISRLGGIGMPADHIIWGDVITDKEEGIDPMGRMMRV